MTLRPGNGLRIVPAGTLSYGVLGIKYYADGRGAQIRTEDILLPRQVAYHWPTPRCLWRKVEGSNPARSERHEPPGFESGCRPFSGTFHCEFGGRTRI